MLKNKGLDLARITDAETDSVWRTRGIICCILDYWESIGLFLLFTARWGVLAFWVWDESVFKPLIGGGKLQKYSREKRIWVAGNNWRRVGSVKIGGERHDHVEWWWSHIILITL